MTPAFPKPDRSFTDEQHMAALQFTRRLNRYLRLINILLVINGIAWAAAIAIMLIGCEPATEPVRTFVIPQGEHYAKPKLIETLQDSELRFEARFDNSAVYDLHDLALQTNKNKLLGFSECNTAHHKNSARFAWQWFNDRIEIYAYCYVDGNRVETFVGTVALNSYDRYSIRLTPAQYIFQLNDEDPIYITRGDVCQTGFYYMLWPYFGGEIAAPHQVRIDIKYPLR
jgi:hypothetical protein